MNNFIAECFGTALLIIFGNGVVANVVLNKSKGQNGGWIVISFGWAMAVYIAVYCTSSYSGAHLNPAVSIALALKANDFSTLPTYLTAQFLGAFIGAVFVYLIYKQQYDETKDASGKLATFCTSPAVYNPIYNFATEAIVTFIFILAILFLGDDVLNKDKVSVGALNALPVSLLVLGIGLSLGGPTGYAINPTRDLGPRLAHAILPIKDKGSNEWYYAWIPVVAPIVGAIAAVYFYKLLF
jgi:glycerol uptake facilitator protein